MPVPPAPPKGGLNRDLLEDIAKLASIYLQNKAETLDFTGEGAFSALSALYELSKTRGGMKKAHAKKIRMIVMAAGAFQHQGGRQETQPGERRHRPALLGWKANSEGVAVLSGNYMLKKIDDQVAKGLSSEQTMEYLKAKERMEQAEKRLEGWLVELKEGLANASVAKAPGMQKTIAAIERVQGVLEMEKQAFCQWAEILNIKGKFDPEPVLNYYVRMSEDHALFTTKEKINFFSSGKSAGPEALAPSFGMLPEGLGAEDRQALAGLVSSRGLTFEKVNDISSKDFVDGYAMLRAHFPPDELDRSKDIIGMMLTDPAYYLILAKDRDGKIVGVCDGNFVADKHCCGMYWAHVSVPGEERRAGIATLLYASTLGLGNSYADKAEKELGATYKTNQAGMKLTSFFLETEPANLADLDSALATLGRLQFHNTLELSVADNGRKLSDKDARKPLSKEEQANAKAALLSHLESELEDYYGTGKEGREKAEEILKVLGKQMKYIIGSLKGYLTFRYSQVDLDWVKNQPFSQKPWNTVPLFLAFRILTGEATSSDALDVLKLQRNAFLNAGGLNEAGIWFDYAFGAAGLAGKEVSIVSLPQTNKELEEFVQRTGTMEERSRLMYPGHNWSKDYLADLKENGKPIPLAQALLALDEKAKRKESTVPSSLLIRLPLKPFCSSQSAP
ncbi:MAG: hypothetical protein WC717_01575 [Candidatus Micrarchaeia archaeon]